MSANAVIHSDLPVLLTRRDVRLRRRATFAVPGLIHSSLTGIVGEPYAGKSGLAALLVSTALAETPFVERPWQTVIDRALIVSTDAGGVDQYESRLDDLALLPQDDPRVRYLEQPARGDDQWRHVANEAGVGSGCLVVIDNLTGIVPDLNSTKDVHAFFTMVERAFCATGATVVVVAHKSEKVGMRGHSKVPMGSTGISSRLRHVVYVDAIAGGVRLTTQGNDNPQQEVFELQRGDYAAEFRVTSVEDLAKGTAKRSKETLDRRAEIARWVVENCQGKSKGEAARLLADRFKGAVGTYSKHLQRAGPLGQQVIVNGGVWTLIADA